MHRVSTPPRAELRATASKRNIDETLRDPPAQPEEMSAIFVVIGIEAKD